MHHHPDVSHTPYPILPARLAWLCWPQQIEHTLALLFHLNAWKRASRQLLYADRQGLQEVQELVLEVAAKVGQIWAVAYFDASQQFPGELRLETAADDAARSVLIHLKNLGDPEIWPPFEPDGPTSYQQFICPLYQRITGQDFPRVADALPALEQEQIRAYIQKRLDALVTRAKATRQPILLRKLAELCLSPVDLLPIGENRVFFLDACDAWDDLEKSDLRKLDPEGESCVTFQYVSSTAEYVFHLPFRCAEQFVPAKQLRALPSPPEGEQERAMFQGKMIDEAESLTHTAKEILQDLGVEITRVCPHGLVDKQAMRAHPAVREMLWLTSEHGASAEVEDPWDGLVLPCSARAFR